MLEVDDTGCGTKDCWGTGRWDCSQVGGWLDMDGRLPWGADDAELRYLLSATESEFVELAHAAALALDVGAWQGVPTLNGGWVEWDRVDEPQLRWTAVASDFLRRYGSGDQVLTEGMLAYATWDLACELAWLRGWCPGQRLTGGSYSSSSSDSLGPASGDA